MLPDIVDHLLHTDSLKLLGLRRPLMEDLCVQIVVVVSDILLRLSKQHHNIDALLDLLRREVRLQHIYIQLVLAKNPDVLVGAIIMGPERIHLVKDL